MNELLSLWLSPRIAAASVAALLGVISFALLRPIPVPLAIIAGAMSGVVALVTPDCPATSFDLVAVLLSLATTATLAALLPAVVCWATGVASFDPQSAAPSHGALPQLVPLLSAWVWLQAGGALWAAQTGADLMCQSTLPHHTWVSLVWPMLTQLAPPLLLLRLSLDSSAALLHHAAPANSPAAHSASAVVPFLTLALLLRSQSLLTEPLAALLEGHP